MVPETVVPTGGEEIVTIGASVSVPVGCVFNEPDPEPESDPDPDPDPSPDALLPPLLIVIFLKNDKSSFPAWSNVCACR